VYREFHTQRKIQLDAMRSMRCARTIIAVKVRIYGLSNADPKLYLISVVSQMLL